MLKSFLIERILDLAVQIQQIPAPTFGEEQRAEFIHNHFLNLGAKDVMVDHYGNVYARIIGRGEKPPLVLSAHMDTVFPAGSDLTCVRSEDRISGPGIGDNALGLAGLLGLFGQFIENKIIPGNLPDLEGDLWLVANVGEEGLGDLRGMKAVVDRFGSDAMAYIVLEGMSLGQIYSRGLGVRRYSISVHTKGGHSWVDFGSPSAIHEIADLTIKIKNLPVPMEPRSSLNVGVIKGGISVNTIAPEASLELDLRSESTQVLDYLSKQVGMLVDEADQKGKEAVQVRAKIIGERPSGELPADHPLIKTAIECFAREGINVKLNIGSTDANEPLYRGYPALCFGLTTGSGSHTLAEYIDTKPVAQGFRILIDLVQSIFRIGANSPH